MLYNRRMTDPGPQDTRRIGKFMTFAAWVVLLGLLTLFFTDRLDRQRNPNQSVVSRLTDAGVSEVVLTRNRYGHYVTSGTVNGQSVEFLLDTGASDVAIPAQMADALGLERGAAVKYRTANGIVTAWTTRLDSISIGPMVIHDVSASINPGMGDMEILLGMSVLKRVEFTQRGDTLILRPYE